MAQVNVTQESIEVLQTAPVIYTANVTQVALEVLQKVYVPPSGGQAPFFTRRTLTGGFPVGGNTC